MQKTHRNMKYLILIFLVWAGFNACTSQSGEKQKEEETKVIPLAEEMIGKKMITNEMAGSAYRKRAIQYFAMAGRDTSGFRPIFTESSENGSIGINLNLPYTNKTETYAQRLNELKLILPKANEDFNLDSLYGMSVGRLILTGDLAIDITKEYKNKLGENEVIEYFDYKKVSAFLLESKLVVDLNSLFAPYSKSVENVIIEKAFFAQKDELLKLSHVVRDTMEVPDKVLDCITWIKFKTE